jgi:hypothetical protein
VGEGCNGKGVFKSYQLPYFKIRSEQLQFFLNGISQSNTDDAQTTCRLNEMPIVTLSILRFDKRKKNPLPLTNHMFCLDWSNASNKEIAEILNILSASKLPTLNPNPNIGDTSEAFGYFSHSVDYKLLKYRHLFVEVEPNELLKKLNDPASKVNPVSLSIPGYIEDENGNKVTELDIIKYVTGQEKPIIAGNIESVLAMGPSEPKNKTEWTIIKANTIAHFLQIVKLIYNSNWLRTGLSISYTSSDPNSKKIIQPSIEKTCSILLLFRQFLFGEYDKLFKKACDHYIEHTSSDSKAVWVRERKIAFTSLLDKPPFVFQVTEFSTRQFIDIFLYGSGLIHPIDNEKLNELKNLIAKYGKDEVAFTIHSCFRQVLGYAIDIYHVIKQDFDYWVKEKGYIGPDIVDVYDLFSGNRFDT